MNAERSFDDVSTDVPVPNFLDERVAELLDRDCDDPISELTLPMRFDPCNQVTGLVGLAGILLAVALLFPYEIWILENSSFFTTRPRFWIQMGILMGIVFPGATVWSVSIAVPMFWHTWLLKRFVATIAITVPAAVGMTFSFVFVMKGRIDDFAPGMITFTTAGVVAAASVAVIIQLCSPWGLTHVSSDPDERSRISIWTLIELTTVIAIVIAFIRLFDHSIPFGFVLTVLAMGAFGALAGILGCIALLRDQSAHRAGLLMTFGAAFAMAFLFVTIIASLEFGWQSVIYQAPISISIGLFGAAIISGTMWICLAWLRACGWRCVR